MSTASVSLAYIPHPPTSNPLKSSSARSLSSIAPAPPAAPSQTQVKLWLMRVCADLRRQPKPQDVAAKGSPTKTEPFELPSFCAFGNSPPETDLPFSFSFKRSPSPSEEDLKRPLHLQWGIPPVNLNAGAVEKSPEAVSLAKEFQSRKVEERLFFLGLQETLHRNIVQTHQEPGDFQNILKKEMITRNAKENQCQ